MRRGKRQLIYASSFCCVLLCAPWMLVSAPIDAGVMKQLAAAREAMQQGDFVGARVALGEVLSKEPGNAEANVQLGLLLGESGNLPAAREAFQKAVRADAALPEAHFNLGLTLVADPSSTRDWPAAISEFREAVRLRPSYAAAHHLLGVGLSETGHRQEAIVEFKTALAADANSPETHLDLGKALEESGDEKDAEREYRECLRLRPAYVDAELALGKLLSESHGGPASDGEAMEHLEMALRFNPDNPGAQYALAKLLQSTGQQDAAAIAFREAAALTKRQQDGVQCTRLSNQGLDAAHQGRREAAVGLLHQAVDLRPDSALAHYNFALMLADHGDTAEALQQAVLAVSLGRLDARFYVILGRLAARFNQMNRARSALHTALSLDPSNAEARTSLEGLSAPAGSSADVSLAFPFGAPSDTPAAHFAFASNLAGKGYWADSLGEWLRVLTLQPANLDAHNNLAVSYSKLQKDDLAELEFRKALQISPDSASAHFGLAVLYLEHQNKQDARRELQEVLRLQPSDDRARKLLLAATR